MTTQAQKAPQVNFDPRLIDFDLAHNKCKIVFRKADGTDRTLVGTTCINYIPEEQWPKEVHEPSLHIRTVYDLEKQAWRSFRYDAVTSFEFITQDDA
jgi:hypothetical protein